MLKLDFDPFPKLTTERLILRQLKTSDAREIFMIRSDKDVNKFIGRQSATTIDEAFKFIRKIQDGVTMKECLYWAITLKNSSKLIGTICYWNILEDRQRAEIGYELLPVFQGKGLMQEAIQRIINFGFEEVNLEMITACPHYKNKKSIKLLKKTKFRRDKNLEQDMIHDVDSYVIYFLSKPAKIPAPPGLTIPV